MQKKYCYRSHSNKLGFHLSKQSKKGRKYFPSTNHPTFFCETYTNKRTGSQSGSGNVIQR